MPTERQNLATFCFNDAHQIFACGGWKNKSTDTNRRGGNALNIVESYSLEYNCWQRLGNMTEIRWLLFYFADITHNNIICLGVGVPEVIIIGKNSFPLSLFNFSMFLHI